MGNFVFQDLNFGQVWREGDPPLANGAEPVGEPDPATSAEPADRWPLVLIGVTLACFIAWRLLPTDGPLFWPNALLGGALALLFWFGIARLRAWMR